MASKHCSIRIPENVNTALDLACREKGVTRTQFITALLSEALGLACVTERNTATELSHANVTHVTHEDFEALVKRVEALERKRKNPTRQKRERAQTPKEKREPGASWSRGPGLYRYNGVEATLNEHLAPIKDAHGKEALAKAKQAVHSSRRRGNTDEDAIHRALSNYECL